VVEPFFFLQKKKKKAYSPKQKLQLCRIKKSKILFIYNLIFLNMKKIIFSLLVLAGISATAQVKVGSNPTTIDTGTTNFQVEGTTTAEQFVILKDGKVGIGTTTPTNKLQVNVDGTSGNNGIVLLNQGGSSIVYSGMFAQHYTGTATAGHAAFLGYKALGTVASPLAVTAGSRVTGLGGYAHNGTTWAYAGSLDINTESDVTGVAETSLSWVNGTGLKFIVKHNGNMGIGTATPNADALLDVSSTTKGLLLPRVALTSTTSFAPLSAHVAGMTVYNTATAGDVVPGTYQNDGTKWVKFGATAPERTITRYVYVDTVNPNTATLFSTSTYYNNNDCLAAVPTAAFTTNASAALAAQTDALYIAQSACDADSDFAEYSFWVWDGTTYIYYTPPSNTAWYRNATVVDNGADKKSDISRDGSITVNNKGTMAEGIRSYNLKNLSDNNVASSTNNIRSIVSALIPTLAIPSTKFATLLNTYIVNRAAFDAGTFPVNSYIQGALIDSYRFGASDNGDITRNTGLQVGYGNLGTGGAGLTTNAFGIHVTPLIQHGTITNSYDIYASAYSGAGTITNKYGLYILGTNKINYFAGNVGIGTTTPTTGLEVGSSNDITLSSTSSSANVGDIVFYEGQAAIEKGRIWTNTSTGLLGLYFRSGTVQPALSVVNNAVGVNVSAPVAPLHVGAPSSTLGVPTTTGSDNSKQMFSMGLDQLGWAGGRLDMGIHNTTYGVWLQARNPLDHSQNRTLLLNPNGGNVGIGTTTPNARTHISGAGISGVFEGLLVANTTTVTDGSASNSSRINLGNSLGRSAYIEGIHNGDGGNSHSLAFATNSGSSLPTEKMRILPNGNVGIGTTAPTSKLQVVGLPVHAGGNAAAITAGLTDGAFYHTGDGIVRVVY
jgi:hypothetical protein